MGVASYAGRSAATATGTRGGVAGGSAPGSCSGSRPSYIFYSESFDIQGCALPSKQSYAVTLSRADAEAEAERRGLG